MQAGGLQAAGLGWAGQDANGILAGWRAVAADWMGADWMETACNMGSHTLDARRGRRIYSIVAAVVFARSFLDIVLNRSFVVLH